MKEYTIEEAREALEPFGIRINKVCRDGDQFGDEGKILWINFYSNNNSLMEKADGYDSANLKPSDFNMIIDGWKES